MYTKINLPSYLTIPANSVVAPPVETRLQTLPFGELTWENFEKLCLRLVELEANIEHCQIYGTRGQNQQGIDLYAKPKFSDKYRVYQCKRENGFSASKIEHAVTKFLSGNWVDKTETLVLCTEESLISTDRATAIETQRNILKAKNIGLETWDSDHLCSKLKNLPKVVDDFFGRQWVGAFCSSEEKEKLSNRLSADAVVEFRNQIASFYKRVFNTYELTTSLDPSNPNLKFLLEDRFVIPDVYIRENIGIRDFSYSITTEFDLKSIDMNSSSTLHKEELTQQNLSIDQRIRINVEQYLVNNSNSIILGATGTGKSSLLRFILTDLLSDLPKLEVLSNKWGTYLPVWLPFPLWTRLINHPSSSTCSLSECIFNWIKSWNEDRLWPIIEKALEDERLLLIVDGLDEWANEEAAHVALDRLKMFVETRNVPTIISARPQAYERLTLQTVGWRVSELSELSPVQQKSLIKIWFKKYLEIEFKDSSLTKDEIENKTEYNSEQFYQELNNIPDLREIAKTSFLLCLLIIEKLQKLQLPRNRFNAYESLIKNFVSIHPIVRRRVASTTEPLSQLGDEDINKILAYLAFQLQTQFSEGIIDRNKACSMIESFFKDNDTGFGFDNFQARKYSKELLNIGEDTIGILINKSVEEIGFFHRSFQEYFAAKHFSQLPLDNQISIIKEKCKDPQWKETILAMFYLTVRQNDLRQFIEVLSKEAKESNLYYKNLINLLLFEVAFGAFNCPPRLAKDIAEEAFKEIEFGDWGSYKERILKIVLDGLRSTYLKEIIKQKLVTWFPCKAKYRQDIYKAMIDWPNSTEVFDCLIKGIFDEEIANQQAAGFVLSQKYRGDDAVGAKIADLSLNSVNPVVRAIALNALLTGWPEHQIIGKAIDLAQISDSPELRLISIKGKTQKNLQTEDDLLELLFLGSSTSGLSYHWRNDIVSLLISGWPNSSLVLKVCLKSARFEIVISSTNDPDLPNIEDDIAIKTLIKGYNQKEKVAKYFGIHIKNKSHMLSLPYDSYESNIWKLFAQYFQNNPLIVEAVDTWLKTKAHLDYETIDAAQIGYTPTAKESLLFLLDGNFSSKAAKALLEGWGVTDSDVFNKLNEIAFGSDLTKASQIANLFPQIINDPIKCKERLLTLLSGEQEINIYNVIRGLQELDNYQFDRNTANTILETLSFHTDIEKYSLPSIIYETFSDDGRVREFALKEIASESYNLPTIAKAYANDTEIRNKIIQLCSPIDTNLRLIIAEYLGEATTDDEFTLSLLSLYRSEENKEVQVQSAISYYSKLIINDKDPNSTLSFLCKELVKNSWIDNRCEAAFCGLLIYKRLDLFDKSRITVRNEEVPVTISMSISGSFADDFPNRPLVKFILNNWNELKASLGDNCLGRISGHKNLTLAWRNICILLDEFPIPQNEAIKYFQNNVPNYPHVSKNLLKFIARSQPKSTLLIDSCINVLGANNKYSSEKQLRRKITNHGLDLYYYIPSHKADYDLYGYGENFTRVTAEKIVASELLGEQFCGDESSLEKILSRIGKEHNFNEHILLLSEGWPKSKELTYAFKWYKEFNLKLPLPVYFALAAKKVAASILFETILEYLTFGDSHTWFWLTFCAKPIIKRLKIDKTFYKMFLKTLYDNPLPSIKISFLKLIVNAQGLTTEIRAWCLDELQAQTDNTSINYNQVGFDILTSELRSVRNTLLETLSFNQPYNN